MGSNTVYSRVYRHTSEMDREQYEQEMPESTRMFIFAVQVLISLFMMINITVLSTGNCRKARRWYATSRVHRNISTRASIQGRNLTFEASDFLLDLTPIRTQNKRRG